MALAISLLGDKRLVFGSGTSLVASFAAIAAGTMLVVNTQFYSGATTCVISDSASDTVTDSGLGTLGDGGNTKAFSQAFLNPTASVTSVTATLGGQSETRMLVYGVTGFSAGTAAFDKTASSTANTASPNSGTTATLSQADEAVFGFAANQNNAYSSMDASYVDEGNFTGGNFSTNGGHKVVSATTGVSYSGTAAGAVPDIIFVVTIKGTLSGGGASPLKFNSSLDGLSSSGGFFRNPLARSMLGWRPGLVTARRKLIVPSRREIERLAA